MDLASFKKNDVLLELLKTASAQQKDVGLSYQWGDKEIVDKLRRHLAEKDLSVWIDSESESMMLTDLVKGVSNCKVTVAFVSEKYEENANCRAELQYVYKKKIPTIFIRTDEDFEPKMGDSLDLIMGGGKPLLLTGKDDEAFDRVVSVIVDKVQGEKKKKEE